MSYHKRTKSEYIKTLEDRFSAQDESSYPTEPIGGGNPYYRCTACGQSDPYVSIEGHFKGCSWWHMYKTIQGLKGENK